MTPKTAFLVFKAFETRTRSPDVLGVTDTFMALTDAAPEWLRDACHEAHGDRLPDDWVYAECEAAYDLLAEHDGDVDSDDVHAHADGRTDVYTRAQFEWAAQFCLSSIFSDAEEQAQDGSVHDESTSMSDRIALIQYHSIEAITNTLVSAWESNKLECVECGDSPRPVAYPIGACSLARGQDYVCGEACFHAHVNGLNVLGGES